MAWKFDIFTSEIENYAMANLFNQKKEKYFHIWKISHSTQRVKITLRASLRAKYCLKQKGSWANLEDLERQCIDYEYQ